jgi:hypothetical protein
MEYMIMQEPGDDKLVQKVNNYLQKGWRLLGQPYTKNHLTCQAMTKGEYIRPARLKEKKG